MILKKFRVHGNTAVIMSTALAVVALGVTAGGQGAAKPAPMSKADMVKRGESCECGRLSRLPHASQDGSAGAGA